jgi:outer membrane protein OmpA-like peptidoglycan-associated protein
VLAASGIEEGDPFALAAEQGWLPRHAAPDKALRLGELSFLLMEAFNIPGSFLYALFPGPRYAFRELDYLRLIPGRQDPAREVSGETLLHILGLVLEYTGETPAAEIPEPPAPPPVPAEPPIETPAPIQPSIPPPVPIGTPAPIQPTIPPPVPVEPPAPVEPPIPPPVPVEPPAAETRREALAGEIRTELEERGVTDTQVRAGDAGITIALRNIQFAPDSAVLTEAERIKLMQIGIILSRYPERKLLVEGHTALAGTEEGRQRLSTERAQAVADFLVYLKVRRKEDIEVRGYGAERPSSDTETNRRVEITLLDGEEQ